MDIIYILSIVLTITPGPGEGTALEIVRDMFGYCEDDPENSLAILEEFKLQYPEVSYPIDSFINNFKELLKNSTKVSEVREQLTKDFFNDIIQKVDSIEDSGHARFLLLQESWARTRENEGELIAQLETSYTSYLEAVALDPDDMKSWARLGWVSKALCKSGEAEKAHLKSLKLAKARGDKSYVAANYSYLGLIEQSRGMLKEAEEYHLKALVLEQKLDNKKKTADSYGHLGLIYKTRGDVKKALTCYLGALEINKDLGREAEMAILYDTLATIHEIQGELEKSVEYWEKSLAINLKLDNKMGMASNFGNLGNIYLTCEILDQAEECHLKSLNLNEELNKMKDMARDCKNLSTIYHVLERPDEAQTYIQASVRIANELASLEKAANKLGNRGLFHKVRGEMAAACTQWRKARELYLEMGSESMVAQMDEWLVEAEQPDSDE